MYFCNFSVRQKKLLFYTIRAAGILSLLLFLAYGSLYFTNFSRRGTIRPEQINKELGHAFTADTGISMPIRFLFSLNGDNSSSSARSSIVFYENDRKLGPGHSLHDMIRNEGHGLFSHWGRYLYFSAGDNTDPSQNGYSYTYSMPLRPNLLVLILLAICILVTLAPWTILLQIPFKEMPAMFFLMLPAFICAVLLGFNFINPMGLAGKLIYMLSLFLIFFIYMFSVFFCSKLFKGKKFLQMAMVLLLSLVWGILSIETAARIFPVKNTLALNPAIKFTWPDWIYFKNNSAGHRDREFSVKKENNTFRILVSGDSFTEGAGCSRQDSYPGDLEKLLNRKLADMKLDGRVEVYNMGHCGYNTQEEVKLIEKESSVYKPDLVTVGYVLNDAERHDSIENRTTPLWCENTHNFFINKLHSYAYYWGFCKFTIFKPQCSLNQMLVQHDKDYPGWKNVEASIRKLKEFSKRENIKVISIIFPMFYNAEKEQYHELYGKVHSQVFDEFNRNGIEVYDLDPYFFGHDANLITFAYSSADAHPNKKAHELTAQFLCDKICESEAFKKFTAAISSRRK